MKKHELEAVIGNLRHFVLLMHDHAHLPIPDEFDPELQAITCANAIIHKAKVEYANGLLMANNSLRDLENLVESMKVVEDEARAEGVYHAGYMEGNAVEVESGAEAEPEGGLDGDNLPPIPLC